MKRQKKKTANDLAAHFQRRCWERLGVILNQHELKNLLVNHSLDVLGKQSNTRTLFLLRKENYAATKLNKDAVLVYDKLRHAFVTAMEYESWKSNHDQNGSRTDLNDDWFIP